ncbi:phospholipid-binding protein [Kovacikia minuta CCNUW1]|uniref:phospholipid-binding protein n=1 Tax=Kovacikia minuta TaxID=2931930 RepID=UPI001CCE10B6|nr:phospholipid-binding protein [Kovacikia minuta]UBF26066.1 phospholipid-binding protein [Kovacikia minuta CCNUW1]
MSSLVYSTNLEGSWDFHAQSKASDSAPDFPSFFKTIPPERVGLNGEYDHSGLAKRVEQTFRKQFQPHLIDKLCITQRGRVVILMGQISSQSLLDQMAELALTVMGATDVETFGVRLVELAEL